MNIISNDIAARFNKRRSKTLKIERTIIFFIEIVTKMPFARLRTIKGGTPKLKLDIVAKIVNKRTTDSKAKL